MPLIYAKLRFPVIATRNPSFVPVLPYFDPPNSSLRCSLTTALSSMCSVSVKPVALPRRALELALVSCRAALSSSPLRSTNS